MERKLLDMMNQLSISEYNPRMKYCDKFQIYGGIYYESNHFNEDATETMQEKIKRMPVAEASRMAVY